MTCMAGSRKTEPRAGMSSVRMSTSFACRRIPPTPVTSLPEVDWGRKPFFLFCTLLLPLCLLSAIIPAERQFADRASLKNVLADWKCSSLWQSFFSACWCAQKRAVDLKGDAGFERGKRLLLMPIISRLDTVDLTCLSASRFFHICQLICCYHSVGFLVTVRFRNLSKSSVPPRFPSVSSNFEFWLTPMVYQILGLNQNIQIPDKTSYDINCRSENMQGCLSVRLCRQWTSSLILLDLAKKCNIGKP